MNALVCFTLAGCECEFSFCYTDRVLRFVSNSIIPCLTSAPCVFVLPCELALKALLDM